MVVTYRPKTLQDSGPLPFDPPYRAGPPAGPGRTGAAAGSTVKPLAVFPWARSVPLGTLGRTSAVQTMTVFSAYTTAGHVGNR
jgi:hypothetical protein